MPYENGIFNDLAKNIIKHDRPEEYLDGELKKVKERALQLNKGREKMAKGFSQVLEALKDVYPSIDLKDENLIGSPNRMARALIETCSGLGTSDKEIFSQSFPCGKYDEMIMLKNIEYTSLCGHHFFPFVGVAHIGYLPDTAAANAKVVGLSKLARIVDVHSRRPQLQEGLCSDIMGSIRNELKPAGVMVVIEGKHGCLACRGARKPDAVMITSAVFGKFKESTKLRSEFLDLLKLKSNI